MSMTKIILQKKIKEQYGVAMLAKWITALPNNLIAKEDKISFIDKMAISLDKKEVESFVNSLPGAPLTSIAPGAPIIVAQKKEEALVSTGPKKKKVPSKYKKGDTLMHPVFKHPYVLLKKKDDCWICGLLTSEESCAEILEKTDSRFFLEEYFTKVIFTTKEPIGTFMYPFENNKQIKSVLEKLKKLFA
jgi:hypothetical protein